MPLTQFLAESILLAVIGGIAGVLAGAVATAVYASSKGWAVVIPIPNAAHRLIANRVSRKDKPPSIATSTDRGTAPTPW